MTNQSTKNNSVAEQARILFYGLPITFQTIYRIDDEINRIKKVYADRIHEDDIQLALEILQSYHQQCIDRMSPTTRKIYGS